MSLEGHIENGKVVLDEASSLPEGTPVRVEPCERPQALAGESASFLDRLREFVGCMDDLPEDSAANLDHDLYGHPKR